MGHIEFAVMHGCRRFLSFHKTLKEIASMNITVRVEGYDILIVSDR